MHSFKMQVYSEDTDSFQIVHHANYIKFMERARTAWLLDLGFRLDRLIEENICFVIKKIAIDYFVPARIYDELEIISRIASHRRVSVVYDQTVMSAREPNIIFCNAMIEVVCVNNRMRPRPVPPELLEY